MAGILSRHGQALGFVFLNATNGIAMGMLQVTLPLFALSLSASPAEIGAIRGASGLGLLLMVIPAGFLVDRYGPRRMFHGGNLAVIGTTVALFLMNSPAPLIVLMLAEGLCRALKFTSLNAAFFQSLPRLGREKVGWFKGSLSIGLAFVGPALGGALVAAGGFDAVFATAVVIMLLAGILVFFIDSEPARGPAQKDFLDTVRADLADFAGLLRHRNVAGSLAMEAIVAASFTAFATFITVMAVSVLHLEPAAATLLLSVEGAAFIVTIFAAGAFVQRLPHHTAALLALAVSAISLSGLSLTGFIALLVVFSLSLGVGLALLNLVSSSCAGNLPGEKGKVAGLFAAATGLGAASGPLLGGLVAERFGPQAVFIALAPLFVLLAASTFSRIRDENAVAGDQADEGSIELRQDPLEVTEGL